MSRVVSHFLGSGKQGNWIVSLAVVPLSLLVLSLGSAQGQAGTQTAPAGGGQAPAAGAQTPATPGGTAAPATQTPEAAQTTGTAAQTGAAIVQSLTAPATQTGTQPAADASQEPAKMTQSPTASTQVDEVSLDLVVLDKSHRPVRDLKPEDLTITDNNTPVKLQGLRLVSGNATSDHLVTIVFDHFSGATARNAQTVALKILNELPSKGFTYSLLDFTGRLRLIQGFTYEKQQIDRAIRAVTEKAADDRTRELELTATTGVIPKAVDKADSDAAAASAAAEKYLISVARTGVDPAGNHVDLKMRARYQTLLTALEDAQRTMRDEHTLPNLAGLMALVKSQSKIAERKSLIYFTQNLQMDTAGKEMVKKVTGIANEAGVSVYVVDLDAMNSAGRHEMQNALLNGQAPYSPVKVATSPYTSSQVPQQESSNGIQGTPSTQGNVWTEKTDVAQMTDFMRNGFEDTRDPLGPNKSPMADLAKNTGGGYIDAQISLKKPLEQMLQDMTTYYEAFYIPPIKEYDGSFRTITAKSVRAGLNVKTKSGYFAVAPGAENGIRPFEVPLMKVLSQTELPSDVMFHAVVVRSGDLPDGNESTAAVEVPLSELQTKEDTHTNLFTAHVSIVAEIKDKTGAVIEHFGEDISKRGSLESSDKNKAEVITLQRHFMSSPGQYTMDVAVLDQLSGKSSAKRIPFEVAAASTDAGPALSDMVLVRKMDAYDEDSDPTEPLKYEKAKVTPNLAGVVPHEAKQVSMFVILHPDPKVTDAPVLEMQVTRNGKPGRRLPLPLKKTTDAQAVPYLATFPNALSPGFYQVKATLTQGGRSAEQSIAFTVMDDKATMAAANEGAGDVNLQAASEVDPQLGGHLSITVPSNPIPPPTPDEEGVLIADARKQALNYRETLPNFLCVEVTNRSIDLSGTGDWKHRDTIAELLRYQDEHETRTTLEINGEASNAERDAMLVKKSAFMGGELGGVFKAVFDPKAQADFKWKETDTLGTGTVQVFGYHVPVENSEFFITGSNNMEIKVAFHGLVYIDAGTHSVRRVTLIAEDIPKDFPTHSTAMAVDYDYVVINTHDYLVPVSAEVSLRQGKHEAVMNTMEFRNYRRYGSTLRILEGPQEQNP
jgi:VWFA-related protein